MNNMLPWYHHWYAVYVHTRYVLLCGAYGVALSRQHQLKLVQTTQLAKEGVHNHALSCKIPIPLYVIFLQNCTSTVRNRKLVRMPTYKLYYFNQMGKGELIRWIFIQAGVPYEDVRLSDQEWAEFKPKTPYGKIPVLEVDGKLLAGSGPIVRYVAEEHGLAGSNALENTELAGTYDLVEDIQTKMVLVFYEKEEKRQAELKKDLQEKHVPEFLGILEKRITDNGTPEGWIYGSKVTYVDLNIVLTIGFLMMIDSNILESYPAVSKLKASVESLPKIAKWIQERPKTHH